MLLACICNQQVYSAPDCSMGTAAPATLRRWGRRPLSERQIQYAAMDALVSVLIYDFIDARSGPFNEPGQQSLSDNQSSANGKHRQPSLGPDQRLPKIQPDLSASRGDAHVASDASRRPCADGPTVGESCLPVSVGSEIINLHRRHEGSSFSYGPGSVNMRSTTVSKDPFKSSRGVVPVQHMQKPPCQAPVSQAQPGLAGKLPVVLTLSQTLPQMSSNSTSARLCCMMSGVLQIATKADSRTARGQRGRSSEL